jgi:hypothetical protein
MIERSLLVSDRLR